MWTSLVNEDTYQEAMEYYRLLMYASAKSAQRGGYAYLDFAVPELTQWLRAYRCGQATWEGWVRAINIADMVYCDWRDWYYNSHPTKPRPEWGGLNEIEFKSVLLAIESGNLTWNDLQK